MIGEIEKRKTLVPIQQMRSEIRCSIRKPDGTIFNLEGQEWFDYTENIGKNEQITRLYIKDQYYDTTYSETLNEEATLEEHIRNALIKPDGTAYQVNGNPWFTKIETDNKNNRIIASTDDYKIMIKEDGTLLTHSGVEHFRNIIFEKHSTIVRKYDYDPSWGIVEADNKPFTYQGQEWFQYIHRTSQGITAIEIATNPQRLREHILLDPKKNILEYGGITKFDNIETLDDGRIIASTKGKDCLLLKDGTFLEFEGQQAWFDRIEFEKNNMSKLYFGNKKALVDQDGIPFVKDGEIWFDEIEVKYDGRIAVVELFDKINNNKTKEK